VFENIVINSDVLSVAIVDNHDVLVEDITYTPDTSAYHWWITWRMVIWVRHVVVWAVRDYYLMDAIWSIYCVCTQYPDVLHVN